jgi:hypothetical protein
MSLMVLKSTWTAASLSALLCMVSALAPTPADAATALPACWQEGPGDDYSVKDGHFRILVQLDRLSAPELAAIISKAQSTYLTPAHYPHSRADSLQLSVDATDPLVKHGASTPKESLKRRVAEELQAIVEIAPAAIRVSCVPKRQPVRMPTRQRGPWRRSGPLVCRPDVNEWGHSSSCACRYSDQRYSPRSGTCLPERD